MYINDSSHHQEPKVKLFVENTSVSLVVNEPITALENLNKNLDNGVPRVNLWKIFCNTDPSKQPQKEYFSCMINKVYQPPLISINSTVQ